MDNENISTYREILEHIQSIRPRTETENIRAWEDGWSENLREYMRTKDKSCLSPHYFKYDKIRYMGGYERVSEQDLAYDWNDKIFRKHLGGLDSIIEFGTGTGRNLVHLNKLFPDTRIYGTDFAQSSVDIIEELHMEYPNIKGYLHNMLKPNNTSMEFSRAIDFINSSVYNNVGILTCHSMEQLGANWQEFFEFIYQLKPNVCVHIEPLLESYDTNSTYDFLAYLYHKAKGYLEGFLPALEKEKRIQITDTQKAHFGSLYHSGYSYIVWESSKHYNMDK